MAVIDSYNGQISALQQKINTTSLKIDDLKSASPSLEKIKKSLDEFTNSQLMASHSLSGASSHWRFTAPDTNQLFIGGNSQTPFNYWFTEYNRRLSEIQTATDLIENPVTGYKKQIADLQAQAAADPAVKNDINVIQQTAAYVQANTKYFIIGGIVLVLLIVGVVVYINVKKQKTLKPL